MFAAPGYTNILVAPTNTSSTVFFTNSNSTAMGMTNGQSTGGPSAGGPSSGPWDINLVNDTNLVPMPTLSPLPDLTNALSINGGVNDFTSLKTNHLNDVWMSADGTTNEPLSSPGTQTIGAPKTITNSTLISTSGGKSYYSPDVDVWLQPGAVAYFYTNAAAVSGGNFTTYVSELNNPTKHVNLHLGLGGQVVLVVPGYITDGNFYDGIDMGFPDTVQITGNSVYPRYNADSFQEPYEWADDTNSVSQSASYSYVSSSLERQLMFRNYVNLLTGFYVFKPDCPNGTGYEPLITEQNPPGAPRPLWGLGPYYPSAPFYWPFGGETNSSGWVTNAMGLDFDATYALLNPSVADPDPDQQYIVGGSRHCEYSMNMLSSNAAPEWCGELFYKSATGGGTNVVSGTGSTSASQIMQSADWKTGLPSWASAWDVSGLMTNESTHNSTISGSPSVWRPNSYNGSNFVLSGLGSVTPGGSITGGYVADGPQGAAGTHYYKNARAWSGRPTHYYDFSKASWEPIADNHDINIQALPLGNWKAWEYAWHARALGITIYTVGYGQLVTEAQQAYLAQIANATNTTAGGGTAITYNPSQPIGQQFYATNATQISNDFYSVGQAINEALTGGN
jgi:hypothetical protein